MQTMRFYSDDYQVSSLSTGGPGRRRVNKSMLEFSVKKWMEWVTCTCWAGKLSNMDVSKSTDTPKSSSLMGFFFINHPFWWKKNLFLGNIHMQLQVGERCESMSPGIMGPFSFFSLLRMTLLWGVELSQDSLF